ncbi:MAG TPA: lysophospholipid acyltransferase family protein [Candidatus Kapabacteria bacterium]|nr:lysophospholipid acyltransferase family protein [Candidatus Kapabacteria bacterium]
MRFYVALPFVLLVTLFYSIVSILVSLVDRSGRVYHRLMRQWSRALLWLFGIRTRVHGTENLERGTCYVYLANHASYLDIIVLGVTIPDSIRFIFKRELARIPFFGWTLALGPYILIDRADARNALGSIERAARQIGEGASVAIFPEGTRTRDGNLGAFKRGGFMLATRSGVPMVPVAIRGTYALLSRTDRRVRPGMVDVFIGKPIPPRPDMTRSQEHELQEEIRSTLMAMLGTPGGSVREANANTNA